MCVRVCVCIYVIILGCYEQVFANSRAWMAYGVWKRRGNGIGYRTPLYRAEYSILPTAPHAHRYVPYVLGIIGIVFTYYIFYLLLEHKHFYVASTPPCILSMETKGKVIGNDKLYRAMIRSAKSDARLL